MVLVGFFVCFFALFWLFGFSFFKSKFGDNSCCCNEGLRLEGRLLYNKESVKSVCWQRPAITTVGLNENSKEQKLKYFSVAFP